MLNNRSMKEPVGFKGYPQEVMTAGKGTPFANPKLKEIIKITELLPNGVSLVTSPSIAVGIDADGYLSPCDGTIIPYGIIGLGLRSTEHLKDNPTVNSANGMDDLHALTPTVWQHNAMFERGYSFKKNGATKAIFDVKVGDLLRPITTTEITTSIGDDTLPPLFGENKADCPKTKAYYAGMLVKFDGSTDKHEMKCARVASVTSGNAFNHRPYTSNKCYDYDIQGKSTKGTSRNVWNSIGSTFDNADYTKTIVEFYVTM